MSLPFPIGIVQRIQMRSWQPEEHTNMQPNAEDGVPASSLESSSSTSLEGGPVDQPGKIEGQRIDPEKCETSRKTEEVVDSFEAQASDRSVPASRVWRMTLLRFGPLSGIASIIVAIASLIAALGILAGSDQQPVSNWSSPPSTYIAVFTAFANLAIRYAAIQGVIIAWWRRAANGSTLAKLHWDWLAGTTLRGALTSGRHIGFLGLACIFSTIVVADGEFPSGASPSRAR